VTPLNASQHPGSQAAPVLLPSRLRAWLSGAVLPGPLGQTAGAICSSRALHLWTGGPPASRLPIASFPLPTAARSQSKRLYAPLVSPGRCTPYVRAHCHASTRS